MTPLVELKGADGTDVPLYTRNQVNLFSDSCWDPLCGESEMQNLQDTHYQNVTIVGDDNGDQSDIIRELDIDFYESFQPFFLR